MTSTMTSTTSEYLRYPNPGWAWPDGGRALLLKAALLPDPAAALTAVRQWMATVDLDDATYAEHRLLAAVAERHGQALAEFPEYPRLKGLQRMLWTQSRLQGHINLPVLKDMADAGLHLLPFKGAARVALNPAVQRQRAHHDIDVLISGDEIGRALQILYDHGWFSAGGESPQFAAARIRKVHGFNFKSDRGGDIDLHRCLFHGSANDPALDKEVWARSLPTTYLGVPVLVPCAEDRLAITLSHGAWSSHGHSDWLVDAAEILAEPGLDWARALTIFEKRRMSFQALIGLSFLAGPLQQNAPPPDVLAALERAPGNGWLARRVALLQARPDAALNRFQRRARDRLVDIANRRRPDAAPDVQLPLFVGLARSASAPLPDTAGLSLQVAVPAQPSAAAEALVDGRYRFEADVHLAAPGLARRIEFELASDERHLARFRFYVAGWQRGTILLRLRGTVRLRASDSALRLDARPGARIGPNDVSERRQKYAALPFAMQSLSLRRLGD